MKNYDEFIEFMLYSENKKFNKVYNEYRHQNFFSEDEHYSAVFYSDGVLEIYNGYLPVDGVKRYSIKQVSKLLGYFDKYLAWLCKQHEIPVYKLNRFKEIKNSFKLSLLETKEEVKLRKELSPLFKEEFISINDIIKSCDICNTKIIKTTTYSKKQKSKAEIIESNTSISKGLEDYFNSRCLVISSICYPINIELITDKSKSVLETIAFKYENGFTKYRLYNGFTRYLSYGNYEEILWIREDNNDTLVILEGEIESLCFSYLYSNVDVASLHNSSAFKTKRDLSKYKNIIFLLDLDQYESSKKVLEKDLKLYNITNYKILSKFDELYYEDGSKIDINNMYIKDKNKLKIMLDNKIYI